MEQREQAHKGTLEERRGGAEGGLTLPGASRKPTKPNAMLIPLRQALDQLQRAMFQDPCELEWSHPGQLRRKRGAVWDVEGRLHSTGEWNQWVPYRGGSYKLEARHGDTGKPGKARG